jgi:hypothetical protein
MSELIEKLRKCLGRFAPIEERNIEAVTEAIEAIQQKDRRIADLESYTLCIRRATTYRQPTKETQQ